MKNILLLSLSILLSSSNIGAQNPQKDYKILLTGASFASPENGWFELGCKALGAEAVNKAIGGEAIASTANRMIDGSLYTLAELESIDAFVIMQVHNKDVADETQLKANYTDYKIPFARTNYAAAYDYVIKRYMTDCYNLKFDKESKYYGTHSGKPAIIVFCTHWHDIRVTYNTAIRTLSQKWGIPLVEFDKYIGFSKDVLHPVTGEQHSILYTNNNREKIDGIEVGWHQNEGQDKYIQQRMGAIFADTMRKILPLK